MIIVWGSIETTSENLERALELSLEHVQRSRTEAGCISHNAQTDAENPNRILFFEEWQDMPALQDHFKVPDSSKFVAEVSKLTTRAPQMRIFEAKQVN